MPGSKSYRCPGNTQAGDGGTNQGWTPSRLGGRSAPGQTGIAVVLGYRNPLTPSCTCQSPPLKLALTNAVHTTSTLFSPLNLSVPNQEIYLIGVSLLKIRDAH